MKKLLIIGALLFIVWVGRAQKPSLAAEMAGTAMRIWKDSFLLEGDKLAKWRYDQGVILMGIESLWNTTGDVKWFNYIQKSMDFFVGENGSIRGYRPDEYNIDHINNGKLLLLLYRVTGKEKYRKAADVLRAQLRTHPRTSGGGFWHKKMYPYQMWLDGLYMAQPFYAEYAALFHEDTAFNDITRQFTLMESVARDPVSGLLYHGWDESRGQQWADKNTGRSPHVWGRALGWYGMAMVDALDHFPEEHPGRDSIIAILNRFARAVVKVQDKRTGLWYDIPDKAATPKNYPEASASSMLVYTLAKAVRKKYLPASYLVSAKKGYAGIISRFIKKENGMVNLHGTVAVSGLGGKPYRDGSFDYYMSEPVVVNDPKGVGAFINAAAEMEIIPFSSVGKGKTVLLDTWFNNEWKKDATGRDVRWHYTWDDKSNSGFSMMCAVFNRYGATTKSLAAAPNKNTLAGADVYIIVDPDTEKETAKPNRFTAQDVDAIAVWVKSGGVLLFFTNDNGNAELASSNLLSGKFGVGFNEDNYNMVPKDQYDLGAVEVKAQNPIFKNAKRVFIKELATLEVKAPAKTILSKEGKNIAAMARYGKGSVFIIGDPWLYNEYIDGRRLPAGFDNYNATEDLVRWSLQQAKRK